MPYGNRMGPENMGPMTGRGLGFCAGYNSGGYLNRGRGLGRGRCSGFRKGGAGFSGNKTPFFSDQTFGKEINRKEILKEQEAFLEAELKSVRERLNADESNLE